MMRHHLFEWILYADANYTDIGSSSVVGPGTTTMSLVMQQTDLVYPMMQSITSVCCLPADNTTNLVLFQHDYYRGRILVLPRSNPDLANVQFDNDVTCYHHWWHLAVAFSFQLPG